MVGECIARLGFGNKQFLRFLSRAAHQSHLNTLNICVEIIPKIAAVNIKETNVSVE